MAHTHGGGASLEQLLSNESLGAAQEWALAVLGGSWSGSQDVALSRALAVLSRQALHEGRIGDGIRLTLTALRRVGRAPQSISEVDQSELAFCLARMLTVTGDFPAANLAIEPYDAVRSESYPPSTRSISRALLARARGGVEDAAAAADAAVTEAERHGNVAVATVGEAVLASVALARGDLHQARTHVRRGRVAASGSPLEGFSTALTWSCMKLAEAEDGADAAVDAMRDTYENLDRRPQLLVDEPDGAAWLVRVAISAGEDRRASRVVACAAQLSAAQPEIQVLAAAANHALGLLERDADLLTDAASQYRHPAAVASALEDAGAALAAEGRCEAARSTLNLALDNYSRISASRDQSRVMRRMAEIDRGGHRTRSVTGWGSLTPAEHIVAGLVSEGLTNPGVAGRMHISRHTVDFHLRQVFRKLGIHSRVELARAAALRAS
ncbi:MAG: helix-turn-helix transcriptional regulator [Actinobacteria bacterium]|nr:helix-turn-helix transcriptional regulator [Actinomycetota bacterium]